ncbi:MAG: MerR family transcriptional regulator [Lachnospiraceae bacterium]|nr:MerR family transcriptional regulator [Lachnospiraceae bacterium]
MKDMYFTTKDMCRIFNVGRETLRHYENIGILNPRINPENGYREYGYWDIGVMIDVMKYKALGLSLGETKKAIFEMDVPDLLQSIEMQLEYYKKQIESYQMLLTRTRADYMHIVFAERHKNELAETYIGDLVLIPFKEDDGEEYIETLKKALENSQFFNSAWVFSNDLDLPADNSCLLAERKYVEYLELKKGIVVSGSKVVGKVVDIEGFQQISKEMFDSFDEEVKSKYPTAGKEIFVALITRFYDNENRYHQYFFTFKKI